MGSSIQVSLVWQEPGYLGHHSCLPGATLAGVGGKWEGQTWDSKVQDIDILTARLSSPHPANCLDFTFNVFGISVFKY